MNTAKTLLATLAITSLFGTSVSFADSDKLSKEDIYNNAPEEIQLILDQAKEDRSSLTDEQKEELKEYFQENGIKRYIRKRHKVRKAIYNNAPEEIQELLKKGKEDRDSLTEEEKDTIKTYFKEQGLKPKLKKARVLNRVFDDAPENIQEIITQLKEDRSTVTDADKETLKEYIKSLRENQE